MNHNYLYLPFLVALGCSTMNVSLSGMEEGSSQEQQGNSSELPSLTELAIESLHKQMKNNPTDSLNKTLMTINPAKEMSSKMKTFTSAFRNNSEMKELFFRKATKLYFPVIKISEIANINNFSSFRYIRVNNEDKKIELCNKDTSFYTLAGLGSETCSVCTVFPLGNILFTEKNLNTHNVMGYDQAPFMNCWSHDYMISEYDNCTSDEKLLLNNLFLEDETRVKDANSSHINNFRKKISNDSIAVASTFIFGRKFPHKSSIRLMNTSTGQCSHYLPCKEYNNLCIVSFDDLDDIFVVVDCTDGIVSTYYVPDHYELSFGAMLLHMCLFNRCGANYFEESTLEEAREKLHEDWFEYYVEILEWLTPFEEVTSGSEDGSIPEDDK